MNTSPLGTVVNSIKHWYIPLIIGVVLAGSGIYVFATPLASYLALSLIFSFSFLVSGILQMTFAIANSKELNILSSQALHSCSGPGLPSCSRVLRASCSPSI